MSNTPTTPSSNIIGFYNRTPGYIALALNNGGKIRLNPNERLLDSKGNPVCDPRLLVYRQYGLEPIFRAVEAQPAPQPAPAPVAKPAAAKPEAAPAKPVEPAAKVEETAPAEPAGDREPLVESDRLRSGETLEVKGKEDVSEADLLNADNFKVIRADGRLVLPLDNFTHTDPAAIKAHVRTKFGQEYASKLVFPK